MSLLNSGAVISVSSAIEGTFNVQPSTGWRTHQPNSDGVTGFFANDKKVARSPLSPNMQREKGDIVDRDASPQIVHDLTKEWLDHYASGTLLTVEKFNGGTGTGRFAVTPTATGVVALTAVAAGAYTVASGGTLQAGTLLFARGFTNAANNGLQIVAASSTGISIKVTAAVLEASPPADAVLEVVGFQFASADLTSTATTLGCTVASFATMGLQPYQWVWVGGGTAAAPGALGFATASNRGAVRLTSIAATSITFDRANTTWGVDAGAGKTIQIFFGSFLRNVSKTSADRSEPSYNLELAVPGLDSGGVTDYFYTFGAFVDMMEINAPAQNLIVCTTTFMGTNVTGPTTTRATGVATAPTPRSTLPYNTTSEIFRLPRISSATIGGTYNTTYLTDVDTWKLKIDTKLTAQKQQGTLGPARVLAGEFDVDMDFNAFLLQPDLINAIHTNETLMSEVGIRNNDGGTLFDIPAATFVGGSPKLPQNGAITLSGTLMAHRDPVSNFTLGITRFPSLPAS